MKETEQHLLNRNQIAATIGQDIVLEQLRKYREQFVSQMKSIVPTSNDVLCLNMQRALGRVEAIDYLITQGENATKSQSNKKE